MFTVFPFLRLHTNKYFTVFRVHTGQRAAKSGHGYYTRNIKATWKQQILCEIMLKLRAAYVRFSLAAAAAVAAAIS